MKRTYLKSAIATVGIFASAVLIQGQGAGGGGGGAGAGPAGGGTVGGVAGGARVGGTAVRAGTSAAGTRAATGRTQTGVAAGMNTVGAGNINGTLAVPPVGGASTLDVTPNTVGGTLSGNSIMTSPTTTGGATATVPGGGAIGNQRALTVTTLPGPVQTALQNAGVNGQVGSVSQVQGVNGPVYQADVTENGLPVQLQISQTGQILSRTPVSTISTAGAIPNSANTAPMGNTFNGIQAGLPLSSLPPAVQSSIQSQLGANAQVESVSQDQLPNGSVYRVTTTQNGVPTEMRFSSSGALLGSAPITGGALTSTVRPGFATTTTTTGVLPGGAILFGDLPTPVQNTVREQTGNGRVNQMTTLQNGTNGTMYAVSYEANGRPMVMTIAPNGRIISNNPIAVGSAATRATGSGSATNAPAGRTNNTNRTTLNLNELPDPVQQALKREAQYAEVRTITREQRVGGDVYTVAVRSDDKVGDLVFDANGKILADNRRTYADLSTPKIDFDDEAVTGIPFTTTPLAIQNAIKAYATASDIRSITLGLDKDGKAVYDVIFYRDGQRDRLVVQKDGTVRRREQNVSPALEPENPNKAPVVAIGDLPQPVRDTIRRQTDGVLVKDITSKQLGSDTVYQVRYQTNGAPVELLVATDGRVVLPEGGPENASAPAPISREALADARVVNTARTPVTVENSGTAAASENGTVSSKTSAAPVAKVDISDVPPGVQNTARRLAGNGTIDAITPKLGDAGVTYQIRFGENGTHRTAVVSKDGAVLSE